MMIDLTKPIRLYNVDEDVALRVFEVIWHDDYVAVLSAEYGIFQSRVMINLNTGVVYGDDFYRSYKAKNENG